MKNIILQQDDTLLNNIKKFFNTLSKNTDIYKHFKQEELDIIRDNIIDQADDNNNWKQIYQQSKSQDNDDEDNIVFESRCMKLIRLIKQQNSDEIKFSQEQPKTDNKATTTTTTTNASATATANKDDLDKAMNDAEQQASSSNKTITLVVTGKNNFEFLDSKNQKFQSKNSLQKIEAFLKANRNILKDAIQNRKNQQNQNKNKNIQEAVNFISQTLFKKSKTLKPFQNQLNTSALTNVLTGFDSNNTLWEKATKRYNFGDQLDDRNEVQKNFYIAAGALICWLAATNFNKPNTGKKNNQKTLNGDVSFESLSTQQIADLMEEKIKQAGKNPKDKNYLQKLLKQKKSWNKSRIQKYNEALQILINKAA